MALSIFLTSLLGGEISDLSHLIIAENEYQEEVIFQNEKFIDFLFDIDTIEKLLCGSSDEVKCISIQIISFLL